MLKTLHGKLAAALGTLLLLIALVLVPLTLFVTRLSREEINQLLNRHLAENVAADKILLRNGEVSKAEMDTVLDTLGHLNPNIETYVLDTKGQILAYPRSAGKPKRTHVNLRPVEAFLKGRNLPIFGDDPHEREGDKVFSAARLNIKGRHEGYIYIILDSHEFESTRALIGRSYSVQLRLGITLGILLCALCAGVLLFNGITRRLTNLASAMEEFQDRDFRGAVPLTPGAGEGDEIERLGAVFGRMAGRIEQQIEALRQADALRREMVSNASHDLRTPLAALRGYLETLVLKEGRMTPEEQHAYLSIAIKHGERLSNLVDELFELSKLDSLQFEPRFEPFHPGELMQDVVQKYQLIADNKGLTLRLETVAGLPFVRGDIGLIERVMENLIENALRHTPPDGTVKVALSAAQESVRVQVSDTGSGIAPVDLPRVFDRFYRASDEITPAGEKASGSGLGLAIVKRILELHGSDVTVQSQSGQGALFTFDLPLYKPEDETEDESKE